MLAIFAEILFWIIERCYRAFNIYFSLPIHTIFRPFWNLKNYLGLITFFVAVFVKKYQVGR